MTQERHEVALAAGEPFSVTRGMEEGAPVEPFAYIDYVMPFVRHGLSIREAVPVDDARGWGERVRMYALDPHDQWAHAVMPYSASPPATPAKGIADDIGALRQEVQALQAKTDELLEALKDVRVGIGAIHSLNEGAVQLRHPLFYGYQEFEDEVLASIGDLGISGVGVNEREAVQELQRRLWAVYEDTHNLPAGEVGGVIVNILRAIQWRIDDVVDA